MVRDWKIDHRTFPIGWLVYYYRGEIKVRKGNVRLGHTFYPEDTDTWQCGIPYRAMEVTTKGRVIVWKEEDIPKAKAMLVDHYLKKIDQVQDIAVSQLLNIKKMIEKERTW